MTSSKKLTFDFCCKLLISYLLHS